MVATFVLFSLIAVLGVTAGTVMTGSANVLIAALVITVVGAAVLALAVDLRNESEP